MKLGVSGIVAIPLRRLSSVRSKHALIRVDTLARHIFSELMKDVGVEESGMLLASLDRPHGVRAVADGVLYEHLASV